MTTPTMSRHIDYVANKTFAGPDEQVDDKALIITPDNVDAADPFLMLSEDWFSSPGSNRHPHRGIETVTIVLDGVLRQTRRHNRSSDQ